MERKLVKQGRNAITVTLPSQWIKNNNLTARDVVYIEENDNVLLINVEKLSQLSEIVIKLQNLDEKYSYHIITDKYIQGYDKIIIQHNNKGMIENLCSRYISMLIEFSSQEELVLKDIVGIPIDNYDNVLKRIIQQLVEQVKRLEVDARQRSNRNFLHDDRIMDYNIIYAMRFINKYTLKSDKDKQKNLLMLYSIETIGDVLKNIASIIYGCSEIAKEVIELTELYVKCLYFNDFKTIYAKIKQVVDKMSKKTYLDGLYFSLTEVMSNYIAYVLEKN